ncbi:MAG: carboxy-S-adenosyl-L-methionine synthase CmoA [Opitutales bacterium TMED158]|nr:MAG: carboxy-S-adenosyl-L-methionine synthase CmoA [Opitutales bacterium TMED158]
MTGPTSRKSACANPVDALAEDVTQSESGKDRIYAAPIERVGEFVFDESVATVFDDMIRRSVPGYAMTLSLLPLIAKRYAAESGRIYDLGCSLGAGLIAAAGGAPESVELIGIDNAQAMLDRCEAHLKQSLPDRQWRLRREDIQKTPIENAGLVLLNFTLQFIPIERRLPLLRKAFHGLDAGGALLLSEKVQFEDRKAQGDLSALHHDFKREQGYSDLEISQKRSSLENVLIPETIDAHKQRLAEAGFDHCEVWLQCFNFVSILAIKG